MAIDSNAKFQALFERLESDLRSRFTTMERRYEDFSHYPASAWDVLTLVEDFEDLSLDPVRKADMTLGGSVILYVQVPRHERTPGAVVLALTGAVRAALVRKPNERAEGEWTTLGGVCRRCWPSGRTEIHQGAASGQVIVTMPVEIVCGPAGR